MAAEQNLILTVIAVGIAGLALILSIFTLGWNVYRDVILKARVRMSFGLNTLHNSTFPEPIKTLILSATNMGPGQIRASMIQLRIAPLWRRILRKTKRAVLMYDYENPLSGKLPARLDVGEGVDLHIRYEKDCFLSKDWTHIGLSDSFGRVHWAKPSEVNKARETYLKKFCVKEGEREGEE